MATKLVTVEQYKEIVAPALEQRPIYVRKDVEQDAGGTDEEVAQKVAQDLPLIRIGDFVVHKNNLTYFSTEVGRQFLPTITVTFSDEEFRCRRTLTSKLDFITLYYGNTADEYFVKQEYVISDIYANPGYDDITLTGFLYIPKMYEQQIRVFNSDNDTDTSWKIVKSLCEELQLGMFSNLDETDDSQTWIQDNCTTYEFLTKTVFPHSFTTADSKVIFFIDQYDYLNMIDMKKAYTNTETEKTSKHPLYGTDLGDTFEVILTSQKYSEDNYPFTISSWTANFRYGARIDVLPETILKNEYDISVLPFEITSNELTTNTTVVKTNYYIEPITSDVHANYRSREHDMQYIDLYYDQGDEITATMSYPIMLLYVGMYAPLKLYTQKYKTEYDDQNSEDNWEDMDESRPEESGIVEKEDTLHSGDYIITSIKYEASKMEANNVQVVTFRRLPLEDPPIITIE